MTMLWKEIKITWKIPQYKISWKWQERNPTWDTDSDWGWQAVSGAIWLGLLSFIRDLPVQVCAELPDEKSSNLK